MRYSIEAKKRRFVKGYGFSSVAKILSNKYGQKVVDSAKRSARDAQKLLAKEQFKKHKRQRGI